MFVNDLPKAMMYCHKMKRAILFLGQPGAGKTDTVHQFVEQLGEMYEEPAGMVQIRGATANPSELADVKFVHHTTGEVHDAPQSGFPTDEKVAEGKFEKYGVVFLDELLDSDKLVSSGLRRIILERQLGSLKLAKHWDVAAASNRVKDKAAANRPSTAVINACFVVNVDISVDAFYHWGLDNDIDYRILAYNRWKPEALSSFDPTLKLENPAFASPRSMHMASDLIKVADKQGELGTPLVNELLKSALGDGVGGEVSGFIEIIDELPDLKGILKDPENCDIPRKMDVLWATVGALIHRATKTNCEAIVKFFSRLNPDIGTVAITDLSHKEPAVFRTKEFKEFAKENVKYAL